MEYTLEISVILPMYNEEREWLTSCIESLINQDFHSYEVIAILDNPNNNLIKKIMANYIDDSKVRYFINSKNLGISETLNRGIDLAQGKYIAIMNSDDIAAKNRLKTQWEFLENNKEFDLIGSNRKLIDEKGRTIDGQEKLLIESYKIKKSLKFMNPTVHPTWMGKNEIFKKIRYKKIIGIEDMDFLCRIMLLGYNVTNINDILLYYRLRKTSISSTNELIQQFLTYKISGFYKSALKTNAIKSYNTNVNHLINDIESTKLSIKNNSLEREFYEYKKIINTLRNEKCLTILFSLSKLLKLSIFSSHSNFFRFKLKRYFYKQLLTKL